MNLPERQAVAKALLDCDAVGFSLSAPVTFKSGIQSPIYVDNRRLLAQPAAWLVIIGGMQALLTARQLPCEVLAGVAVGGVPHSSALAYALGMPSAFVRKASKGHGTGRRIEGADVAERRVLLVEDLITTGGSALSAVYALRQQGAIVQDVLAVLSYGFAGARTAFAAADLQLHTLTDFDVLLRLAQSTGRLDAQQLASVREWFAEPYAWSAT